MSSGDFFLKAPPFWENLGRSTQTVRIENARLRKDELLEKPRERLAVLPTFWLIEKIFLCYR